MSERYSYDVQAEEILADMAYQGFISQQQRCARAKSVVRRYLNKHVYDAVESCAQIAERMGNDAAAKEIRLFRHIDDSFTIGVFKEEKDGSQTSIAEIAIPRAELTEERLLKEMRHIAEITDQVEKKET